MMSATYSQTSQHDIMCVYLYRNTEIGSDKANVARLTLD